MFENTAEETRKKREELQNKYTYLNEAMFKIKNPNYISPFENFTPTDYKPFSNDEINYIYDTLREPYKTLADNGNPTEDSKYNEAAVMYATVMGTSYNEAKDRVKLYYPLIAERDFSKKNYGSALWGSIKNAYYNDQLGYATSMFMATKNDYWKEQADNIYEEMMKTRNWQSYNAFGDFFLDNMQGLYSAGKMGIETALTSVVGGALGLGAKALTWLNWGASTIDSGLTQQGSNTYLLSKTKDENGNPLFDFNNVSALEQLSFVGSALAMGLIETSSDQLFSMLPKSIRNAVSTSMGLKGVEKTLSSEVVKKSLGKLALSSAYNVGKNILGEGAEEFLQQIVGNVYENVQVDIKNKFGGNFEYKPIMEDTISSFIGGLKGSVLASILSVGTASILNNKTAKKIQEQTHIFQNTTENSHTIYNDFINTQDYTFTEEEIKTRAEDIKTNKADPINLYKTGNYFGFFTDREGALTMEAKKLLDTSSIATEGQVIESVKHNLLTDKKKGNFASSLGATLGENSNLYFETQEQLDNAKQRIEKIKGFTLKDNTLTVETTNGVETFELKLGEKKENLTSEDKAKIKEFIKINNIARTETESKALNSFVEKIYGITKGGKNASIDNFLNSLSFVFDDTIKGTSQGSIEIQETDLNGYKKGVIHLTKNATFETLTHELNHYIQNNASQESLKGFEEAYKINLNDKDIWNKQISQEIRKQRGIKNKNYTYAELFANDAEKYYKYGIAQNSKLKSLFSKMKEALKSFVNFLKAKKLNNETLKAFDILFNNSQETNLNETILNDFNKDSNLYYDTDENGQNYDFTNAETLKELKQKDFIIPPRQEIFNIDEDIENDYRLLEIQKSTGNDLVKQAREIRENYELLQDSEEDINGIFTDEDRKKLNELKASQQEESNENNVESELYNIFVEKARDNIGAIEDEVLELAWKLSNILTDRQKDLNFIYNYASSYEGLLEFINIINKTQQRFEDGSLVYDYNDYNIRQDILDLKKNSPKALLQEAMNTIKRDPRSYRVAFENASDMQKGDFAIEKRAYERMINNEMLSYLGLDNYQEEEITDEELNIRLTESITDLRNISKLKSIPQELKNALGNSEEEIRKLTKEIKDREKEKSKESKKQLKEKQKELEKAQRENEALKEKIAKYIEKTEIGKQIKRINKLSKPSNKSHSYKANSSFLWLRLKFIDELNSASYESDLNEFNLLNEIGDTQYSIDNPPSFLDYLLNIHNLKDKTELNTLEDYKNLNSLLRDLRKVASLQLQEDENTRREAIFETRKKAYNEEFGEKGVYSKGENFTLSFYDENAVKELNKRINQISDINEKKDFLSKVKNQMDKWYLATAHPFSIMQSIDKTTSGTFQDIHKVLKESEYAMQKSINERFKKVAKEIKKLGIEDKGKLDTYLASKINENNQEYYVERRLKDATEKVPLTRNQAIMLYGYALQEDGYNKLVNELGNNFTQESVDNLCDNLLSQKDKQLLEILSNNLSSKWKEIARVYARQNNKIMQKNASYFPLFASQNSFSQSVNTDMSGNNLRTTLHNSSRYANKSMTQTRTSQVYALKLDLWNNFLRGIQTQEKYIYQSDWIRDAQYWISPRGMGTALSRAKGQLWTKTIKDYINDIAEPQARLSELNGFMSTIFSNMTVANLMFNTVSAVKQFGAIAGILTDKNFKFTSFCKAIADLTFRHKETVNSILEANPFIESQKGGDTDFNEKFEESKSKRNLDKFKEAGLKMADFTDLQGRYIVWQTAYQSYLDRFGVTEENIIKAKESANRVIEETQNNNRRSELSSLQSKTSFLGSEKLAYTNSTFLYLNKFYEAIHLVKNKDITQATKHIAMLLTNAMYMTLLSGVFFKPVEDDEEKKEKWKDIFWQNLEDTLSSFVPFGGEVVSTFMGGYQGASSLYDVSALPREVRKAIKNYQEGDKKQGFASVVNSLGEVSKPLFAGPQNMLKRITKGLTDEDSENLSTTTINTLINLILGTGFYNNIKGR